MKSPSLQGKVAIHSTPVDDFDTEQYEIEDIEMDDELNDAE